MATDRNRYDPDRFGGRDTDWSEDEGYIARRGFGNPRAGYDRRLGPEEPHARHRARDFGDSSGYGTGGSALDWHDVVGDERPLFEFGHRRQWNRYEPDRYGRGQYGTESFGRGSRDYGEERGFLERAGDEVRSWFGDEEAERRRESDVRETGRYRGRGPKGYLRSDARILEDVSDRLTEDPHIDASEIEVRVDKREVTLSGTVTNRFEKRHAEDIAESVSGVTHVQNNLRIQQPADAGIAGSTMSGAGAAGAGSVGVPDAASSGQGLRRKGGSSGSGG